MILNFYMMLVYSTHAKVILVLIQIDPENHLKK